MMFRIFAGIIAIVLMLAYLVPPAIKLKDLALVLVIALGVVLMLVDLYQSLRERE
ncbi:MAG: hypothetical protein IT531_14610 [Burkholderiales bacterium]|nr:hypothetical protein [Burkholderiales bacterium]